LPAIDNRSALPSLSGSGSRTCSPSALMRSPANARRITSSVSRIRASGCANGTPCSPSMTCGPDVPSPSANRLPDIAANVSAVWAVIAGERTPSWNTPEPSSIREVRDAR
jgi:hypothetical protein